MTVRRLAVILAADVVDNSRLVSADEADALARLATLLRGTHQNVPINRSLSDLGERIPGCNVPGVRLHRQVIAAGPDEAADGRR
jgi:hypothetical protein